jgi:hypothetical protein
MTTLAFKALIFSVWILTSLSMNAADPISKVIDLRSKIEPNNYYIVFCARNNTVSGHAFVVTGMENADKKLSTVNAFGLYPVEESDNVKAVFTTVPGNIVDEYTRDVEKGSANMSADMVRLILRVDKSDYDAVEALRNTWARRNDFKLIQNDCVTFVIEAANQLALKVPDRKVWNLPWAYITKLLEFNSQSMFLDGAWVSSDPTKRFRIEIKHDNCTWTERSGTGTELKRNVKLTVIDGGYKVSRNNDDEVLTFLGFQPTLRNEILAKAPLPSFLILKRTDNVITGNWNGLVAVKDANAHLKELKQPGQTPSKDFTFEKEE